MTDKEFEKLKEDIEVKIRELETLQKKHHKLSGVDHRMPCYLSTPKHLEGV